MKQKIVVSNVRFPYEDWMIVKAGAADMGMSINEYFQYLSNVDQIMKMTGIKYTSTKPSGYEAMDKFLNRKITGKPMGASDDDKAIYGIE